MEVNRSSDTKRPCVKKSIWQGEQIFLQVFSPLFALADFGALYACVALAFQKYNLIIF